VASLSWRKLRYHAAYHAVGLPGRVKLSTSAVSLWDTRDCLVYCYYYYYYAIFLMQSEGLAAGRILSMVFVCLMGRLETGM
jgi:hypothetical protein